MNTVIYHGRRIFWNCAGCGALLGAAEGLQQKVRYKLDTKYRNDPSNQRLDLSKVGFAFATGVAVGPFMYYWYLFLDRKFPGIDARSIAKKVTIDQLVFSPLGIVGFFYGFNYFDGGTKEDFKTIMKQSFVKTYAADLCYWPIVQAANFRFVPSKYRVIYVSTAAFFWTTFLCYMKEIE